MKAVLLNPPGRRRRGRRRNHPVLDASASLYSSMGAAALGRSKKAKRRKARRPLGKRPKVGRGCSLKMMRYAAWKKRHARVLGGRKAARKRKSARKAGMLAGLQSYFSGRSNPRGRRRNDGGSMWIPDFGRGNSDGEHDGPSSNPRRRRNAAFNYGTEYSRKKNDGSTWIPAFRNPYWVPRYAQNPGNIVGSLTKGFQPKVIISTLPYIGGALGNAFASNFIKKFMPEILKTGIGGSAVDIASAGLLGASVGLLAPRYAGQVFFGGVIDTVLTLANQYVKPLLGMSGLGCMSGNCGGYLTAADAAAAQPLNGFGDYATTADVAAAQPLGQFYDLQAEEYSADIV